MFIYRITNTTNNKVYIGQTIQSASRRWGQHLSLLRNGRHSNIHLQGSFNLYGIEAFLLEIIHECKSLEEMYDLEIVNIIRHRSVNKLYGFNQSFGGGGVQHTTESKAKLSKARIGVVLTDEHKAKISAGGKGRVCSETTRAKISKMLTGKYGGKNSPNFGKSPSELNRQRTREAQTGRKHSPERIKARADAIRGRPSWNKGLKQTPEHIAKLSAVRKGRVVWNKGRKLTNEELLKVREQRRIRKEQRAINAS